MLFSPLQYNNGITLDALFVSGDFVCANAETDCERIKKQAPDIFKSEEPSRFRKQLAVGSLEKPKAIARINSKN